MITPFMSNDKLKDKQLQQNAERNRNASEKTKEASLINRKITNQLAGLSIDGKMVGFAMPVSCQSTLFCVVLILLVRVVSVV